MLQWIHDHHDDLTALSPLATIFAACVVASVTGVFAYVQAGIAGAQKDIAREKLRSDVFDKNYERRIAIYEATRTFLADVFEDKVSEATVKSYGLRALDAKFVFYEDADLPKYLMRIRGEVAMWYDAKMSAEKTQSSDEKKKFESSAAEHLSWIIQQGDDTAGFDAKFIPFLVSSVFLDAKLARR
jgi:hypothetical protein